MRPALDERRHGLWEHVAVDKKKRKTSQFAPFFYSSKFVENMFFEGGRVMGFGMCSPAFRYVFVVH